MLMPFIPLFVFLSLPGIKPEDLGFSEYVFINKSQVKVTWSNFFRVVGVNKAIKLATAFYNHQGSNEWCIPLNVNGIHYITFDGIYYKQKKNPSFFKRVKNAFSFSLKSIL